jgi:hypothetical protein
MIRRRGVSLVELITVISGCAILLSLCGVLMHRSMQTQAHTRYFFVVERTAMRLADQFRTDVHAALAAERRSEDASDDQVEFLRLELPEGEAVVYRREGAGVVRLLSRDGEVVARERFPLASVGELLLEEEEAPLRLVLTIAADPDDSLPSLDRPAAGIRESPISFQVAAVVGRDQRHAPADADQEASP